MNINSIWQAVTWDVARAGGFTAYILLTLAIGVGLMLSAQIQSPSRWPRMLNSELHNFLTLISTVFLGVHILAVWIDPFTHFGWNEIFIPFVSTYRTVWMALGIVALYLGIAIGISTLLRPRIGYLWWRRLHVLTLGIYVIATLHAIGTGSDTQTWWGFGIYLISTVLVGSLLYRRIIVTRNKRKHVPAQVKPAMPVRNMGAVPQSTPRIPNATRVAATHLTNQRQAQGTRMSNQNRAEVARLK